MAASLNISKTINGLINVNSAINLNNNQGVTAQPTSVAAAQPGLLTVRTDANNGQMNMVNSNHGITTGGRLDIYWNNPDGSIGKCHSAVVGTIAGLTVPFTISVGDSLPVAGTSVFAAMPKMVPFSVIGDNVTALVASSDQNAQFVFADDTGDILAVAIPARDAYEWHFGGVTNPLAGEILTKVYMSHMNAAGPSVGMVAAALSS